MYVKETLNFLYRGRMNFFPKVVNTDFLPLTFLEPSSVRLSTFF